MGMGSSLLGSQRHMREALEYCKPTLPYPSGRVPVRIESDPGTFLQSRVGSGGFKIFAGRVGRV